MNIKKIFAGIMAVCVVSGVMLSADMILDNTIITAGAIDEAEYTEGTYEMLTYANYGDHIEIKACDQSATEVVIPHEIEGLPVTNIGNKAFAGCSGLTSIEIPNSVTSIGKLAFSYCKSLTSINIPDSVTSIRSGSFLYCKSLTSINIPDSVTNIGDDAFCCCSGLTSINIPDGVTSIERAAFYGCSGLKSINIPDSITSIGFRAFSDCTSLTSVTILNHECEIYDYTNTISNGENDEPYFNGTIYGYENSTAQGYAEKYGYKFEVLGEAPVKESALGDVDGDGKTDSSDTSRILAEYSLLSTSGEGTFTDSMKKIG